MSQPHGMSPFREQSFRCSRIERRAGKTPGFTFSLHESGTIIGMIHDQCA